MKNGKPDFELSVETRILIDAFAKLEKGQSVSYAALTEKLGQRVTGGHPALQSAKRVLLRDSGMVFAPIRGEGLKRLTDEEIIGSGEKRIQGIRRAAKRAVRVTAQADYDALSEEAKVKHNANLSLFGVFRLMTNRDRVKALEARIAETQSEIPAQKILEFYQGK